MPNDRVKMGIASLGPRRVLSNRECHKLAVPEYAHT